MPWYMQPHLAKIVEAHPPPPCQDGPPTRENALECLRAARAQEGAAHIDGRHHRLGCYSFPGGPPQSIEGIPLTTRQDEENDDYQSEQYERTFRGGGTVQIDWQDVDATLSPGRPVD